MTLNVVERERCCWSAGITTTTKCMIHRKWSEKIRKEWRYPAFVWRKMPCWCQGSEVRTGRLVRDHRKATVSQITTGYNQDVHTYMYTVYICSNILTGHLWSKYMWQQIFWFVSILFLLFFNDWKYTWRCRPVSCTLLEVYFETSSQLVWLSLQVGAYHFFHISTISCQMLLRWVWMWLCPVNVV